MTRMDFARRRLLMGREYTWERWEATATYSQVIDSNPSRVTFSASTVTEYSADQPVTMTDTGETFFPRGYSTVTGNGTAAQAAGALSAWWRTTASPAANYYYGARSVSGNYVQPQTRIYVQATYYQSSIYLGTVTSRNRGAYPDNGYQDGYWYILVQN